MPQSLVKLLIHVVFSTKNRADLILPEIESDLYGYLNGIISGNDSKLILANGTTNHVHLLVSLGKTISISELGGDIKRNSSKWIKKQNPHFRDFYWQEGYGAPESESGEKGILELILEKEKSSAEKLKPFKRDEKAPFAHPYDWSPFILIGNWK